MGNVSPSLALKGRILLRVDMFDAHRAVCAQVEEAKKESPPSKKAMGSPSDSEASDRSMEDRKKEMMRGAFR